tara:strand:+ start:2773 stop:2907 length:135 start_codon:yes stop_codon:yes gene_type:complete
LKVCITHYKFIERKDLIDFYLKHKHLAKIIPIIKEVEEKPTISI